MCMQVLYDFTSPARGHLSSGGAETAVYVEDAVACIGVFCKKCGGVGHFVDGTEAAQRNVGQSAGIQISRGEL